MNRKLLASLLLVAGCAPLEPQQDEPGSTSAPLVLTSTTLCPVPTLAQCQTAAFFETACGKLQRKANSGCAQLLKASYPDAGQKLSYSASTMTASGAGLSAALDLERRQVAALNPTQSAQRLAETKKRMGWMLTPGLLSCEEYVYSTYSPLYTFEESAFTFGRDFLRAAELAVRTTSPGLNRPLTRLDGQPLPSMALFSPATQYQVNPFKAFKPGGYPLGVPSSVRFIWSPALLSRISAAASYNSFTPTWSSYARVTSALVSRGATQEQLARVADAKKRLSELSRQRDLIWGPRLQGTAWVAAPQLVADPAVTGAQLAAVDAQIQALLLDLDASYGCLDSTTPSVCDFEPARFIAELQWHALRYRDAALRRCARQTGGDFATSALVRNAKSRGLRDAVKDDYTQTVDDLEAFFVLVERARADYDSQTTKFVGPQQQQMRRLAFGTAPDSRKASDADFGVQTSWTLGGDVVWPVNQPCLADATIDGSFVAKGKLFGLERPVVDATLHLQTTPTAGASYVAAVNLPGGIDIAASGPFTGINLVSLSREKGRDVTLVEVVFMVGPIPVAVSAGVAGQVGVKMSLGLNANRACSPSTGVDFLTLQGNLEPYVEADAWAKAVAGIEGLASVELRVDLSLVHLHLPFDASLRLSFDGANHVRGTAGLGLDLSSLDGRVVGKVSVLFIPIEVELFSWPGLRYRPRLFDERWDLLMVE